MLAGYKLIPEMHLRKPGFTYSACGSFPKNNKREQQFKETWYSSYIYQNELDKACFQHETVSRDFKELTKRTTSDKILHDKAFNIAKNPKYDRYQRGLLQWFINFLIKRLQVVSLCLHAQRP